MKQQKTRKRIEAAFIEPMQCKPVTALPADEKWTFDIKLDGLSLHRGKEATLFSRHRKVLNKRFPEVAQVIASLEGDFVLDGELVAVDPQGKP
jgi:DNA ligase-1